MYYQVTIYQANELDADSVGSFKTDSVEKVYHIVQLVFAMNRYLARPLMLSIEPLDEGKEGRK